MKLWAKILISIALGAIAGYILGPQTAFIKPVGSLFLNLLNMLIVPLIFASMVSGISHISSSSKLGRVGTKTLLMYALTTLFAIGLGLFLLKTVPIGETLSLTSQDNVAAKSLPSFSEILISMIPRNPIQSFADGNVLQIIIFSIFFGTALKFAGIKGAPLLEAIESLAAVMSRLTSMVMKFAPIGVFALMASATGAFGLELLLPVGKFLLLYYAACILHIVIVFCGILWGMARLNPIAFFRGIGPAIATAASTCSSSASLPVSIQCAIEKLGISKSMANFVLPLGCSLNMNGSALFQAMAALFVAQCYGIDLEWQQMLTLGSTILMATLGTASIPGGGFLMLSIVFSAVGIPLEGLAILAGIDRLRDMGTTILNITGDAVCAVYVAKQEGELDERIYSSTTASSLSEAAA